MKRPKAARWSLSVHLGGNLLCQVAAAGWFRCTYPKSHNVLHHPPTNVAQGCMGRGSRATVLIRRSDAAARRLRPSAEGARGCLSLTPSRQLAGARVEVHPLAEGQTSTKELCIIETQTRMAWNYAAGTVS
ncbi:hypothetical protein F5883DRAFT_155871 [Diaporthe sp. PMI_573]|nr:hypothetical protein F5883DRAFT_155871 [Diaporthaceae sp. PMI_573]